MIYLSLTSFFAFIALCIIHDRHKPTILKPTDDNRPFTSEELKQMGIVAPERYDCETFVRGIDRSVKQLRDEIRASGAVVTQNWNTLDK